MARKLTVNSTQQDIIEVVRALEQSHDRVVGGGLTVRQNIDMRGYRLVNLAEPVDSKDAQTKIAESTTAFAPLTSKYVVAGSTDSALPNERVLAGSTSITLTDGGNGGTLAISATQAFFDALYQPLDADLTSWAAITRGTGFDTAAAIAVGSAGAFVTNGGALGTPSSGTLTSCTGLPAIAGLTETFTGQSLKVLRVNVGETAFELAAFAGGGDALVANPLSQFAATTSAQLRGVISDENGTGVLLFDSATSPTFAGTIAGASETLTGSLTLLTNNTSKLVGKSVAGTNDYSLFVNSSNEWQLNANVGGAFNANYRFGLSAFYSSTSEDLGLTGSRWGTAFLTDLTITNPVTVANGGTGRATGTTAYSLIATGTTATGAQQTLANGLTTQILVGGGASALPAWTTATGSGSPVRAVDALLTRPTVEQGNSLDYATIGGTVYAHDQSTTPGNAAGSGDTDLISASVAASSLVNNGDWLEITADAGLTNARFRVVVGLTTVYDSGAGVTDAIRYRATVTRDSSTSFIYSYSAFKLASVAGNVYQSGSVTAWSGAVTVKGVGNGASANAVTMTDLKIIYHRVNS